MLNKMKTLKPEKILFFKIKKIFRYCESTESLKWKCTLSPNKFEQVTLEDNVKEIINIEQYDNNSNNNPTRPATKKLHVSEARIFLNNCNRPSTIVKRQIYLEVEDQDIEDQLPS